MSTAYHPQTDGQTENANAVMEPYLRCNVNYLQDDWDTLLPHAKFVCNNAVSALTKVTLSDTNLGLHPPVGSEPPGPQSHIPRD